MKALLVLAAATVASAAVSQICNIPAKYATATGTACSAVNPGYQISAYCTNFYQDAAAQGITGARPQDVLPITSTNVGTVLTAATPAGCQVSGLTAWAAFATATGLAVADACTAFATPFVLAQTQLKGLSITCAAGYYPSAGVEGSAFCLPPTAPGATTVNAFWVSAGGDLEPAGATWPTQELTCGLPCTLDAAICTGTGVLQANSVLFGAGLIANTCQVRPGATIQLVCRSNPFVTIPATCVAGATITTPGTLNFGAGVTANCGPADGVSTGFYILDQVSGPLTQTANTIENFPAATSVLTKTATANVGQWGGIRAEPFQSASAYQVAVTGCPVGPTNAECVQRTINYWRCRGLTIDSASVCTAAGVRIACPTHTNGFRCKSSSKKGLLGLLGLLGLIPLLLCLLLCCFLIPCCLRRKKTEGDVHFATFDPHAAPAVGATFAPGASCYAPSVACGAPVVY